MSALPPAKLAELADAAAGVAERVGRWIGTQRPLQVESKSEMVGAAASVVTEVDLEAEARILGGLRALGGDFGLLTEERADSGSRRECEFFWCVDPLDGTLPFVEGGDGYAVSIALVANCGTPYIGAVYEPARGALYCAARGLGVRACDSNASDAGLSLYLDRSMQSHAAYSEFVLGMETLAAKRGLALELRFGAGAVVNACRVLTSANAAYVKFPRSGSGGGSLWDFAATACLFGEAGRPATDIHGAPLELNRAESTFLGHRGVLYASGDPLATEIRALARSLG